MGLARFLIGINALTRPPRRAVVTIGMFDGVHLAHQQLVKKTLRLARQLRGTSVAITFNPDPQGVLDQSRAQPLLMPLEKRVACLQALGMDLVWVIPFTKQFSGMTAEQFVHRVLARKLRAKALVIGEDFAFGKRRGGDLKLLKMLSALHQIRVIAVRSIVRYGSTVSSSRIRKLVSVGQLSLAARLLGKPYSLYGNVTKGLGRGRLLGFPTANIKLIPQVLPPDGVYAVAANRIGKWLSRRCAGMRSSPGGQFLGFGLMNLGRRPTFGPGALVCEVHIIGFSGTLLGKGLSVSVIERIRDEKRFPSADALRLQIKEDVLRARRIFTRFGLP